VSGGGLTCRETVYIRFLSDGWVTEHALTMTMKQYHFAMRSGESAVPVVGAIGCVARGGLVIAVMDAEFTVRVKALQYDWAEAWLYFPTLP
jgi:hypothetical protein